MKKLISLLALSLISLSILAQTQHARAYLFTIGYRDKWTGEIVWNGKPSECNILIEIKGNEVVVYSRTEQHYHVISKMDENEDGVMYRMSDASGTKCNFYMGPIEGSESIYMAIEYNDYSWMYTCIDE